MNTVNQTAMWLGTHAATRQQVSVRPAALNRGDQVMTRFASSV